MTETKSESKKTDKKKPSENTKTSDTETKDTSSSKNTKAPARTTSYFSSVSTDDYREGWKTIFSGAQKKTKKKGSEYTKSKKKKDIKSFTIRLSDDVLDSERRAARKYDQRRSIAVQDILGIILYTHIWLFPKKNQLLPLVIILVNKMLLHP